MVSKDVQGRRVHRDSGGFISLQDEREHSLDFGLGMSENKRQSCRREKGVFRAHDFGIRVQTSRVTMKMK